METKLKINKSRNVS